MSPTEGRDDRPPSATARSPLEARTQARAEAAEDLRRSEERFSLLVHSIKDYAIFFLDPQGYIRSWNEGAERLKGYTEQEILGRHFSVFYPPEDRAGGLPERLLRQAEQEGRCEHEGWRVRRDGTRFWADVVITALRDREGRLVGFGKVTRDLTERRQLEQERLARAAAEEAVRLRDEFLGAAAHELKTPLTSLRLQVQLLARQLSRAGTLDPARVQRAVAMVDEQSRKLTALVERLLDVSRLAHGRLALDLAETDVTRLVAEAVERQRALAPDCPLTLEGPASLVAWVDPLRLEQVVTNLLDNAVKHGGERPIAVTVARPVPGRLQIAVRDQGPGVPAGQRAHLFERFFQADSRNVRAGLGLGLYISRQIVRQHGGELAAEFPAEGGSRFVVTLPVCLGEATAPPLPDVADP